MMSPRKSSPVFDRRSAMRAPNARLNSSHPVLNEAGFQVSDMLLSNVELQQHKLITRRYNQMESVTDEDF